MPSDINIILSATLRANSISCVTTIIVLSEDFKFLITFSTSPVSSGSSALVGSSKQRTSGLRARARAIATRCCCPPDSSQGYASFLSRRPIWLNSSSALLATLFCISFKLLGKLLTFIFSFSSSAASVIFCTLYWEIGWSWNTRPKCSLFFRVSAHPALPAICIKNCLTVNNNLSHIRSLKIEASEQCCLSTTGGAYNGKNVTLIQSEVDPFSTSSFPNALYGFLLQVLAYLTSVIIHSLFKITKRSVRTENNR